MPTPATQAKITPLLVEELKRLLGEEKVSSAKEDLFVYAYDASLGERSAPDVAVFPTRAEDVVALVKFAVEHRIPIYPRGAGTGRTGGAVPSHGGIALVMTRMNRILEINCEDLTATVEPGVVLHELKEAALKVGLLYPPDPASAKACTIGGNVAECAGGLRGMKYGVTRDYVLRLEVVTMDGALLRLGAATMKSVTGYDLVRLIVGSEGTLAIVTKITVKLIPAPETQRTFLALFDGPAAALECSAAIGRSLMIPAALEFMDERVIRCALAYQPMPWLEGAKSALLIELDGARLQVDADAKKMRELLSEMKCSEVREAAEESEREQLWAVRRSLSPATLRISPQKVSEDISVPRSKQLDVLRIMEDLEKKYGIEIIAFSHAGDGNFHVNFMLDEKKPDQRKVIDDAVRELFERTIALGGTLSGEHGIGNTKSRYLGIEYGEAEIEMMKKVKALWDPLGLLNPGKIFP